MKNQEKYKYKVKSIFCKQSKEEWKSLQDVCSHFNTGWVVLWQNHGVFTGKIMKDGKEPQWYAGSPEDGKEHLIRLRVFNEEQEYHFWRTGEGIKGRSRRDGVGEKSVQSIDTQMALRGVVGAPLKKDRVEWADKSKEEKGPTLYLKSRQYLATHPKTHQVSYVDCRFLTFFDPQTTEQ